MDCTAARERLLDQRRGRLDPSTGEELALHLRACDACRVEAEAEVLLDRLLVERLPREELPSSLRERLARLAADGEAPASTPRRPRRAWQLTAVATAAALLGAAGALLAERRAEREGAADPLVAEAVSDHLRVLAAARPPEVASGTTHEVKPWFAGRLDFAPAVPGDVGELRLEGGSVGYFRDRKAAVISYGLRRHRITLLAFPAAGLPWPAPTGEASGVPVATGASLGFHVVLWRHGELGYALVSDLGGADLRAVAGDLAPATAR